MKLAVSTESVSTKQLPIIAIDFDGTMVEQLPGTKYLPADKLVLLQPMVDYIKHLLEHGDPEYGKVEVWVFTARVAYTDERAKISEALIKKVCRDTFGLEFPVTALKIPRIARIVDDKACRIDHNTGHPCPGCKAHYKL